MPRPNSCCNPLNKKSHSRIFKNVKLVNENWSDVYQKLIGKYICDSCRRSILKSNSVEELQFKNIDISHIDVENEFTNGKDANIDSASSSDNESKDPSYQFDSEDENLKRKSTGDILEASEVKRGKSSSNAEKSTAGSTDIKNQTFINDVKTALSKAISRKDKYIILSTLPRDWSIRKLQNEFGVSRRLASNAKKLRQSIGYGATPNKKRGRPLSKNVVEEVENFYTSDQWSRLMPGRKDYVTIVENDNREQKQKRLLLHNIKELHAKFISEKPEFNISLSAFAKLRPRYCIPVGSKGTHNVCVCPTHQNMRLKFISMNDVFNKIHVKCSYSVHDVCKLMVCENSTSKCFLLECKDCPGVESSLEMFAKLFDDHKIEKITFKSWKKTDRGELSSCTQTTEDFLKDLAKEFPLLLQHDYIAKSQASFFDQAKKNVREGDFVVCLDFAENFSFVIQDAIQAHHWSNKQVTLHPYVIYYKKNFKTEHHSFVTISECNKHDSVAVNLFNRKMIQYLINIHGKQQIKKLIFFSDGAASQYKNKSNFINMTYLQKDTDIRIEWNFFASSHGKGACDGIGGTVKRNAYRASLQRPIDSQITTPQHFFDWAKSFFQKISFDFCTTAEYEIEQQNLKSRFSKAIMIPNTRKYHSFQPATEQKHILCKIISSIDKSDLRKIEM